MIFSSNKLNDNKLVNFGFGLDVPPCSKRP